MQRSWSVPVMVLSELAAVDAAYQLLYPLDPAARRRALQWLSDALSAEGPSPHQSTDTTAPPPAASASVSARRSRPPVASPNGSVTSPAARSRGGRRGEGADTPPPSLTTRRQPRRVSAVLSAPTFPPAGERAYRRMPPAEDVLAAYAQVGTVSALADHFGVPRHTVQGWARQLRKQGHSIGRTS